MKLIQVPTLLLGGERTISVFLGAAGDDEIAVKDNQYVPVRPTKGTVGRKIIGMLESRSDEYSVIIEGMGG